MVSVRLGQASLVPLPRSLAQPLPLLPVQSCPHWCCSVEQITAVLWGRLPQTAGGELLRARRSFAACTRRTPYSTSTVSENSTRFLGSAKRPKTALTLTLRHLSFLFRIQLLRYRRSSRAQ